MTLRLEGAEAIDDNSGTVFADRLMSVRKAALSLRDALRAIDVNPLIVSRAGDIAVDALATPAA